MVGLDAICHQPLVMCVSEDQSVRVWDWSRHTNVLTNGMGEQLLCCALHPSGFMCLIGMLDKLRMYYIIKVGESSVCVCITSARG